MKIKYFGLIETELFHFYRIFKIGGQGGGRANPLSPLWIRHSEKPGAFPAILEKGPWPKLGRK